MSAIYFSNRPTAFQQLHARSRAVIAIDRDIFFGEVAGQHAVATLAEAERHLDLDLRIFIALETSASS